MGIKVLKKGKRRKVTCEVCGALLSFKSKHIQPVELTDFTGYKEIEGRIACPECKSVLKV